MKSFLDKVCLLTILAGVVACAPITPNLPPPNLDDAIVVKALTTRTRDEYKKETNLKGPELSPVKYENLYLQAVRRDGQPVLFLVFVRDQYRDSWRFYDSAFDIDGNKLQFVSLDRQTDNCRFGCDFYETMAIGLPLEYLEQRRKRGLNFKVVGKSGERVVNVSGGYVAGFVDAFKSQ